MRLNDAIDLSANWSAQLVITDPTDKCGFGTNTDFGTLYIWVMGHTHPVMQTGWVKEQPAAADSEVCVCGEKHGFPSGRAELLQDIL